MPGDAQLASPRAHAHRLEAELSAARAVIDAMFAPEAPEEPDRASPDTLAPRDAGALDPQEPVDRFCGRMTDGVCILDRAGQVLRAKAAALEIRSLAGMEEPEAAQVLGEAMRGGTEAARLEIVSAPTTSRSPASTDPLAEIVQGRARRPSPPSRHGRSPCAARSESRSAGPGPTSAGAGHPRAQQLDY